MYALHVKIFVHMYNILRSILLLLLRMIRIKKYILETEKSAIFLEISDIFKYEYISYIYH